MNSSCMLKHDTDLCASGALRLACSQLRSAKVKNPYRPRSLPEVVHVPHDVTGGTLSRVNLTLAIELSTCIAMLLRRRGESG